MDTVVPEWCGEEIVDDGFGCTPDVGGHVLYVGHTNGNSRKGHNWFSVEEERDGNLGVRGRFRLFG